MVEPDELIVGRVYFDIYYEDENLRYPFIHSYEYCGRSERGDYEFRQIGTGDYCRFGEESVKSMERVDELWASLSKWGRENPDLLP